MTRLGSRLMLVGTFLLGAAFGALGLTVVHHGPSGLVHAQSAPAAGSQTQSADPGLASVILNWHALRNQGDDNAAGALFADNTFFVRASGGACSLQAPCYDAASSLQSLQAGDTGAHVCLTVTSIQVDGSIVTGRTEVRNDANRNNGIERTVVAWMAEVRGGKIVSFFNRADQADPQTAMGAAIAAGTAQAGTPIPTPNPPCS